LQGGLSHPCAPLVTGLAVIDENENTRTLAAKVKTHQRSAQKTQKFCSLFVKHITDGTIDLLCFP